MKFTQARVMGPVGNFDNSSFDLPSPLQMDSFEDYMFLREGFSDWAVNVKACADDGENMSKCSVTCLSQKFSRPLVIGPKEKIKLSVRSGEVILKPGVEGTEYKQVEIIYKLVKTVSNDTRVYCISLMVRLTQMFTNVRGRRAKVSNDTSEVLRFLH